MFTAIVPELMSVTVFILTILCICAGKTPTTLPDYGILSLDTTFLKVNYHTKTNSTLPIHDVYTLYMQTHCDGFYQDGFKRSLINVQCSEPASNSKFKPADYIARDLAMNNSKENITSIAFPQEIQRAFTYRFNTQIYVAFIFYVMGLICVGAAVTWGFACLFFGPLGSFTVIFTSLGSTCLLIAAALAAAVQDQAVDLINELGTPVGITAFFNRGFIAMTWCAFVINSISSVAWVIAGTISTAHHA